MNTTTQARFALRWWDRLTAPHPSITDIERRRQSRLLSTIELIVIGVIVASELQQLTDPTASISDQLTGLAISFFLYVLPFVVLYFLNRTGRYTLSAYGLILVVFFANVIAPLLIPSAWADSLGGGLVLLLSSIFLTVQATTVLLIVSVTIQLFFLHLLPPNGTIATWFTIPLTVLIGGCALTLLWHRTGLERERRAELERVNKNLRASEVALQEANATLEQRVIERTFDLEAARNQAERADKVKSAFLASMSHELRTPLNAIINFTKFVAKGRYGPVSESQAEILNQVTDSSNHLLALINDVLDMSKIESGSLTLFIEDNVALHPIIEGTLSITRSLLGEKPVEISLEIPNDLPSIRADKQRIRQILLNMLSNACKFTEKGAITLKVYLEQNNVVLAVQDTGPGIAAQDQAAVFEAFKQTATGLRQGGGTGLGMPISRNLAQAHGGRLWLSSDVGKGTTFYLSLPIKSEVLVPTLVA